MYKLIQTSTNNFVFDLINEKSIPIDENNIDYQEYLKWLSENNQSKTLNSELI